MKGFKSLLALAHGPLLAAAVAGPARAESAPVCFLAGQAQPRFHLELSLNGQTAKSVTPKPTKVKALLKQLDEGDLRPGENRLDVTYRVAPGVPDDASPTPSFIVRVYRQGDPRDKNTREELAKLRGPGRPFAEAADGALSATSQVPQ